MNGKTDLKYNFETPLCSLFKAQSNKKAKKKIYFTSMKLSLSIPTLVLYLFMVILSLTNAYQIENYSPYSQVVNT